MRAQVDGLAGIATIWRRKRAIFRLGTTSDELHSQSATDKVDNTTHIERSKH